MKDLWGARFSKSASDAMRALNSSIAVDSRMWREDIAGSLAHSSMLAKTGVLSEEDKERIHAGLDGIKADIESGALSIDPTAEDIHMFVEGELTRRIGDAGKRLHTARSRNDQVATDLRLYLRGEAEIIGKQLRCLLETLCDTASAHTETIMPGYTHLQRAQPVTFGFYMTAYANMFLRDLRRLAECQARLNQMPLGSCALAGTTYPIDRDFTAELLGFEKPCDNAMDAVSDRDFAIELTFVLALTSAHLSRFAEEIILWCSSEFRFISLDDAFATGSSIMPQKKNPDAAELARGKTARVFGDLTTLLTMIKGLPLSYNKDLQEDKEAVFDAVDTVKLVLAAFVPMIATMTVNKENMLAAAQSGFLAATDCADYLVGKGMPFRDAYGVVGNLVAFCEQRGKVFETLSLGEYREFSELFAHDIYGIIDLAACVNKRRSFGATAPERVEEQIGLIREHLK